MEIEVDAMVEGAPALPASSTARDLETLLRAAQADCAAALPGALLAKKARSPRWPLPALASVSLVLCDDAYICSLNAAHRGKDVATDVLSFEVPDEPGELPPPIKLLGDLVISLDTAARQAEERGYALEDELRVLLVHGLLHLCGFDHEQGQEQMDAMAAAEAGIMGDLGWRGQGLIEAAHTAAEDDSGDEGGDGERNGPGSGSSGSGSSSGTAGSGAHGGGRVVAAGSASSSSSLDSSDSGAAVRAASGSLASTASWRAESVVTATRGFRSSDVRLVAIDMDGTLLDGRSRILPSSAAAIRAALSRGVRVILATGKARPAALAACADAGLAGDGLLVSRSGPGVFLQGLAVHGHDGRQLSDATLPSPVVAAAFDWASAAGVSCVAFLGDECATLELTPDLVDLHTTYYEPLAAVAPSVDALVAGPPVRKLLFMAAADRVAGEVLPHWAQQLAGGRGSGSSGGLAGAEVMQAVPNMLEIVPSGVNKWGGLTVLLDHLGMGREHLMALGDGGNDTEMIRNAGLGVAMGNAVPETLAVAAAVVASHNDDGVAEAFERFIL